MSAIVLLNHQYMLQSLHSLTLVHVMGGGGGVSNLVNFIGPEGHPLERQVIL